MAGAVPRWPSEYTRLLIEGHYSQLFKQTEAVFGTGRAYRVILRSVLGRAEEVDAGAFEEPRR